MLRDRGLLQWKVLHEWEGVRGDADGRRVCLGHPWL